MKFFKNEKLKIGLALGSGAARGLAHIGFLKALKEENIAIDMIAGSSMGAFIGACYARKGEIANLEEVILKINWKELARLADPNLALFFKGIIHGKRVKELLRTLIGDISFKDLKIPLSVVATDVNTGEEVIIKEGSVIEAVRASISIPAIFMPVKFSGRFLMDGGIVNPIPVKIAKDMGAMFVIACNVIRKYGLKPQTSIKKGKAPEPVLKTITKEAGLPGLNSTINKLIQENKDRFGSFQKFVETLKATIYKETPRIDPKTPNVFYTVVQAIYTMEYEIAREKAKEADVVVTPEAGHIGTLEFYRGKEAILAGYKAAKKAGLATLFERFK